MIASLIKHDNLIVDAKCREQLIELYGKYINHSFDLLGSGWVKIGYSMNAKGYRGVRYHSGFMKYFNNIYGILKRRYCISEQYEPINWYIDYKSGFLFNPMLYNTSEKCSAVIGKKYGVDIKCPWELGRLYHFPQMAILAASDHSYANSVIQEFKDEVHDFIMMNPVGKTVQWSAVMDVSIRTVNLLVAFDILKSIQGNEMFDAQFQELFEKLIRDSLALIMNNLEYSPKNNSNHYLSNLAGVIFASAYLPAGAWTDACLVFGVQELIREVSVQFGTDGGHYEGSTSYHRLSYEFAVYATALIYGVLRTERRHAFENYDKSCIPRLNDAKFQKYDTNTAAFFPQEYLDRLYNAAVFTSYIMKSNGEITQVGDNDSGRLLKLSPVLLDGREHVLNHGTMLSAANGLFQDGTLERYAGEFPLERSFIASLGGIELAGQRMHNTQLLSYSSSWDYGKLNYKKTTVIYRDGDAGCESLLKNLSIHYFDKFGVLIVKSERLDLAFVIDTTGIVGGHTHNDKLSFELMVDKQYITHDPGGYIYTADPKARDKFRSVKAHNTIHCKKMEQNTWDGTFHVIRRAHAKLLYCKDNKIAAECRYADVVHVREMTISDHEVTVDDYANVPFSVGFQNKIYSVGYGRLEGRS